MIDQAKVEHDESRKQELETERDVAELEKHLRKERERLRDLARMRGRCTNVEGDIPSQDRLEAAWQLDRQIRELEGETLDAQVDAASMQKEFAEAAVEITKARKNIWEAQQELISRTGQAG